MAEYLDYDQVVSINLEFCGAGAGVADEGGIRGVLSRPSSGFGEHETFPTIWLKAASLLHGFATTQHFFDGNKRSAYLVATTFLDVNGYEIETPAPVQAEAFVLAVAADLLPLEKVAEWLEVAHQQRHPGPAFDPRVEYLLISRGATFADGDGTVSILGGNWAGMLVDPIDEPFLVPMSVCARIHWAPSDLGQGHTFAVTVASDNPAAASLLDGGVWQTELFAPPVGGHLHQPGGIMPAIVVTQLIVPIAGEGNYRFRVNIDGRLAGVIPFKVNVA